MKKKIVILCAVLLAVLLPMRVHGVGAYDDTVNLTLAEAHELILEGLPAIWDLESHLYDLNYTRNEMDIEFRRYVRGRTRDIVNAWNRKSIELDREIAVVEMNIEVLALRTKFVLHTTVANIIGAEMDIDTAEASIAIERENLRHVTLRHRLGLASASDLRAANTRINQAYMNLDNLHTAAAIARESLNELLGLAACQYVIIEFERILPEIPEDLAYYITQKVLQTPTARRMQITVNRYQEELAWHQYNCIYSRRRRNECETCETLTESHKRAVIDRDLEIRRMEVALRITYNRLEQLQTGEMAARLALELGLYNLEMVKTNYDLGRVTQLDVDRAAMSLAVLEQTIERNLYQQWLLKITINNPELL